MDGQRRQRVGELHCLGGCSDVPGREARFSGGIASGRGSMSLRRQGGREKFGAPAPCLNPRGVWFSLGSRGFVWLAQRIVGQAKKRVRRLRTTRFPRPSGTATSKP